MAINASGQYNGGRLPDIIMLTQSYYHRGTHLNAMKRFCICSLIAPKRFDIFPPDWGMLRRSRRVQILLNPFGTIGLVYIPQVVYAYFVSNRRC